LAAWRDEPFKNHAPGGESLMEALDRARSATGTIRQGDDVQEDDDQASSVSPAEPVLGYERTLRVDRTPWSVVVAHDGILRLLMLDLMGVPIERFWSFPFALASITVLDLSSDVVRLRAHNLDEHIAALGN
jgi:broad specificity phosphatase PhoE